MLRTCSTWHRMNHGYWCLWGRWNADLVEISSTIGTQIQKSWCMQACFNSKKRRSERDKAINTATAWRTSYLGVTFWPSWYSNSRTIPQFFSDFRRKTFSSPQILYEQRMLPLEMVEPTCTTHLTSWISVSGERILVMIVLMLAKMFVYFLNSSASLEFGQWCIKSSRGKKETGWEGNV